MVRSSKVELVTQTWGIQNKVKEIHWSVVELNLKTKESSTAREREERTGPSLVTVTAYKSMLRLILFYFWKNGETNFWYIHLYVIRLFSPL